MKKAGNSGIELCQSLKHYPNIPVYSGAIVAEQARNQLLNVLLNVSNPPLG